MKTMRHVLFCLAVLVLPVPVTAQEITATTIKWQQDYNEAMDLAQASGKPVVLFFTGSDSCGWCKRFKKEILDTAEFQKLVYNQFVFIEVDFPRYIMQSEELKSQNQQLAERYSIRGYPTLIILDSSGKYLNTTGYRALSPSGYAQYLFQLARP